MTIRTLLRGVLFFGALAAGATALFQASLANKPQGSTEKIVVATTQTLGGESRYLTHLSTDKPIYRPGEKFYLRGVLLHHASRKPLDDQQQATALVEIKGPKGDTVASGWVNTQESLLGFSWDVPQAQAGGQYTAKVTYPGVGYPPAERNFDIRSYRAPRLKSQIKFLRDGYGPGDEVVATLNTQRAEGGAPVGAKVTIIARVDGEEVFRGPAIVDQQGNCQARFRLPVDIRRGEGTLAMVIEDGGVVETASKTIPILLQTVDLTMYAEGGELVAGLSNRVYFEAFTPAKKPADLSGVVLDASGKQVAKFRSEHEGRGRFTITPKLGETYTLKITQPAGINTQYPLPQVKPTGVTLRASRDRFGPQDKITVNLGSTAAGQFTVTLRQSEKQIDAQTVRLDGGETDQVALDPHEVSGILIATVWNAQGQPLAERLVFRQAADLIHIKITADAERYTPGGKARLTIQTTNSVGQPVSAMVGVTVTDDSVLEMIEKRDQAPRLPAMALLEADVKELADAHIYFNPTNEKAPLAVDLLLGTQGWRRFAFVDPAKFIQQHGDVARRALALRMVSLEERQKGQRHIFRLGALGGDRDALDGAAPPPRAAAPGPVDEGPVNENRPLDENKNLPPAPQAEPEADEEADRPHQSAARENQAAASKPQLNRRRPVEADEDRAELAKALESAEKADDKRAFLNQGQAKDALRRIRSDFVAIRLYAHQPRSDRQPGQRTDFTETLYWNAGIETDEHGRATVEFALNDSVTSFAVLADAFGQNGALGVADANIESVEPFYIEPKLPLEVTSGDTLRIPVGVVNSTTGLLTQASIQIDAHDSLQIDSALARFNLVADARLRRLIDVRVGQFNGDAHITLSAAAGPYADRVTRHIAVRPLGFPVEVGRGGLISPGQMVSHLINIPNDLVPGSLTVRALVYPTPLANMTEALERLIREPCGCFEQTSSSVYPLVMAQQYFMSHQGVDPSLIQRSSLILETGYQRLTGFESKSGGYEWFGGDPGHDALTAYGLLEFTDMSQVRHVDPDMLERTRKWLLAQRDGKGGFARKTHTLHTWVADPECANSYNTWALLEAGIDADLSTEVEWIRAAGEKSSNTYAVALAANVLALAGDQEGANHLLDKLAGKQTEDGSLEEATTSVVGSGGEALAIEATALAVTAWLTNPSYAANVEKSIQYLAEICKAGRFGSTQSTILALRAIVAYDKSRAKPKAPGSLRLIVDGQAVGAPVPFTADTQGAIELPDFAHLLTSGKHQMQLQMSDGSQMPYSLAFDYHRLKPDTSRDCKLHLEVALRDTKIDEGGVTEAAVTLINRTGQTVPTPMAIIGLPGGLEPRHDQLKELVKSGRVAAYEVIGREVVLYWRALEAEERVELNISLVAAIPGSYTGPASRAYLYYTDEHKHWVDALQVEITPKLE